MRVLAHCRMDINNTEAEHPPSAPFVDKARLCDNKNVRRGNLIIANELGEGKMKATKEMGINLFQNYKCPMYFDINRYP